VKATSHSTPAARRNPWWIPPFLGRVPDIEPRLITLLGVVSLALLFENYDLSLLGAALKDVAEDLQIPENHLGFFSSAIRLGALPAFLIIPLTDRIGRRRMFLVAVVALGLGTCLTAFTQTEMQFLVVQILTRAAMLVAAALAFVILAEELPAAHRGWGFGMLAAISAVGHGVGAALFALVEVLPFGWRALYAIGVAPVLLLPLLRREIPETERFVRHRAKREQAGEQSGWFEPMRMILRDRPGRAAIIIAVGALSAAGTAVVFQFIGYFVRTVHQWEPWRYSVMVIVCGAVGVLGNVAGGRMADRFGRRVVGVVMFTGFPVFAWMFFRGPGWSLPIVWILLVLTTLASGVVARAFATELFPTEQRGTSAGAMVLAETVGAGIGLSLLSFLSAEPGDLIAVLPLVASVTLIAGLLLLLLPETSGVELELISEAPPLEPRPRVPLPAGEVVESYSSSTTPIAP